MFMPELWFDRLLLIDGQPRSGKSLVASAFSSLEPFEPWQIPISVDHVVMYLELGFFPPKAAAAILRNNLNSESFDSAVGRNLNRRKMDQSSIFGTHGIESLAAREVDDSYESLLNIAKRDGNIPVFVTHDNIEHLDFWLTSIPTVSVVETMRSPASMMISWHKRSIVSRWGTDPIMFVPCTDNGGEPVPIYALNHAEEWIAASDLERLMLSAEIQYNKLFNAVRSTFSSELESVCFVRIEEFKRRPDITMSRLCAWLGIDFREDQFADFCRLESLPRLASSSELKSDLDILKGTFPKSLHKRLEMLNGSYDSLVEDSLSRPNPRLI